MAGRLGDPGHRSGDVHGAGRLRHPGEVAVGPEAHVLVAHVQVHTLRKKHTQKPNKKRTVFGGCATPCKKGAKKTRQFLGCAISFWRPCGNGKAEGAMSRNEARRREHVQTLSKSRVSLPKC